MPNLFADYDPDGPRDLPRFQGLIRVVTPADTPAIAAIKAEREGTATDDSEQGLRNELQGIADGDDRQLWVATEGTATLGYARTWFHDRSPDAPPKAGPPGWYLAGVVVDVAARRRGVALALTRSRLDWIAERADEAFYFCNERNLVSIALHDALGFEQIRRDIWMPGCHFTDGVGLLFRASLG